MKYTTPLLPGALALVMLAAAIPCPAQSSYDLLFRGGRVVDGTGAPWFAADVGVRDGRIAAVGRLAGAVAKRVVDATGLVVAPGFIDLLGQSEYNVLVDGRAASKITQGITTEVTGEGDSIAPIDERMIAESQDVYESYGVRPDFRTLDGYFEAVRAPRRGRSTSAPSSARAASATSSSAARTGARRPRSSRGWRSSSTRRCARARSASPPRCSTCPTSSRRPRSSSRWRRSPRATAGPTSPTSAPSPTASTPRSTRCSASRRKRASARRSGT